MKKIILMGILISILPGIKLSAEENRIKSKGNIKGIINFYSGDVTYLESEIEQLLEECREVCYE